jgi:putative tricarboxylic transport membrane protein
VVVSAVSGQEYFDWLGRNEQMHRVLMKEAGFIAN